MTVRVFRSRVLWTAFLLIASYWLPALALPYWFFAEFVNWACFFMAVIVVLAYTPVAFEALAAERIENRHQLVLGIVLSWSMMAAIRVWSAAGRYWDFDTGLADSMITGWYGWIVTLAAVLHLTAPVEADNRVPPRSWWLVGFGIFGGGAIAGAILASAWWSAAPR